MRASALASVQKTHCLPFRLGRWPFVRNGEIREFDKLRRELLLQVDPTLRVR